MRARVSLVFCVILALCHGQDTTTQSDTTAKPTTTTPDPPPDQDVIDKWVSFQKTASSGMEDLMRKMLPTVTRMSSEVDISTACTSSLLKLIFGLRSLKNWAVRMVDASGRIPSGLLEGSLSDLGNMDECFMIQNIDEYSGKEVFRGQHCAINAVPVLPKKPFQVTFGSNVLDLSNYTAKDSVFMDFSKKAPFFYRVLIRIGVCIPSTCTRKDLETVLTEVTKDSMFNVTVPFCQVQEEFEISTLQIVILSVIGVVALLVMIGTIVTRFCEIEKDGSGCAHEMLRICDCFSLDTNYKSLMGTSKSLQAMDGVRVLSTLWIILVHTYAFQNENSVGRIMEIVNLTENISFGVVVNAWVSVDSFFLLGGILLSYTTLRTLRKNGGKFQVVRFVLRRVWRLSPCILFVMGGLFLLPLVDRGPNWPESIGLEIERCYKHWWATLFYMNSWGDFHETCMIHTWYLSADLQLYLLSAIPVYLLYRWPRLGFMCCISLIFSSMCVVAVITYVYHLYPTILFLSPDVEQMRLVGTVIYLRPFTHLAPYLIGVLVGYALVENMDQKPMKVIGALGGWLSSLSLLSAVLFGAFKWHNGLNALPWESAFYGSVHRGAWGIGLGWIVYACCTGRGSFINTFLSWRIFNPISRLTYLMYLIHMVAIWQRNGSRRESFYLRHYDFIYEFFGNMVCATTLAFVGHLLVEAPFAALDKILFPVAKTEGNSSTGGKETSANAKLVSPKRSLSPSREMTKSNALHAYRTNVDAPLALNNNSRLQSSHM